MGTHPIFESDFDCLTGMSFGSDSLFAAFGTDGWSANNSKAPSVEDAYKATPGVDNSNQKINELLLENQRLKRILNIIRPPKQNKDSETGPICQINFYHNSASRHHKDEIIKLGRIQTKFLPNMYNQSCKTRIPGLIFQSCRFYK